MPETAQSITSAETQKQNILSHKNTVMCDAMNGVIPAEMDGMTTIVNDTTIDENISQTSESVESM